MHKLTFVHVAFLTLSAIPVLTLAQSAPRPSGISPYDATWVQVTGKDCWIRNSDATDETTVEWTGACQDGFGTGPGTATFHIAYYGTEIIFGILDKGTFNGKAVVDQTMDVTHTHIEVDDAKNSLIAGQGTITRDVAGKKVFEYNGQIVFMFASGKGHGVIYDPQTGDVETDYTGLWKNGKPYTQAVADAENTIKPVSAVIAKKKIQWWSGLSGVGTQVPTGIFEPNTHFCIQNEPVVWNGKKFLKIIMPDGMPMMAEFEASSFIREPEKDKACRTEFRPKQ